MNRRIFFSDNGTLTDYTVELNDYHAGTSTFSLVAAEDAIYIGSDLPFNHIYVKMGSTVNAETSAMTVQYWYDDEWKDNVEIIDETSSGGKTLAQSGFVSWVPDKDYRWSKEDTNYNSDEVTGLTSVVIYQLYWIKITFDNDLTADMNLSWIGQKFSKDEELYSEYPEFNNTNFKTAFESGKTDWEEQHVRAAKVLIQDMIKKNIISGKEQILERYVLMPASVCRVAEIIYRSMGDDYKDEKIEAHNEYLSRLKRINFKTDLNKNAILDTTEKFWKTGYFNR